MNNYNLREIIVDEISKMLDNPDKYEIYPTGICYDNLEYRINAYINKQLQAYKDREDKLREYIESPNFLEWYLGDVGGEYQQEILLQILNEGSDGNE